MSSPYFSELKDELLLGVEQSAHPFRYGTLGTVGLEYLARLRIIKLRNVSKDLILTFFTDKRSKKILHIKENPKVSLLLYHPEKMLQLRIEGIAKIIRDESILAEQWQKVHEESKKDYSTASAPGTEIGSQHMIEYLDNENYFCSVEISPFKIEYLKLQKPDHLRIRFSREGSHWKSEFLVP